MSKTPIVEIEPMTFEESAFIRGIYRWSASTLYEYAKQKKLKPFNLPLVGLDLSGSNKGFDSSDLNSFIFHCQRVMNCDTNIPIILDDYGQIADGYHRICKAILEGKTHIKAIRLNDMPKVDEIIKE